MNKIFSLLIIAGINPYIINNQNKCFGRIRNKRFIFQTTSRRLSKATNDEACNVCIALFLFLQIKQYFNLHNLPLVWYSRRGCTCDQKKMLLLPQKEHKFKMCQMYESILQGTYRQLDSVVNVYGQNMIRTSHKNSLTVVTIVY